MPVTADYLGAVIMYNLQVLPELLMTGLIVLAVALANPALLFVAIGAGGTQLLTGAAGRLVMQYMPDQAIVSANMTQCNTGFIGTAWGRLLRGTPSPDLLWHPKAPSIYMATLGFLAGYSWAAQLLYKDEIEAGVLKQSTMTAMAALTFIVLIAATIFRYTTGCETLMTILTGLVLGLIFGYFGAIALGYSTGRRATNIWGIPLLRDRINNGSAIYVCPETA
jgi:hypothetical protein